MGVEFHPHRASPSCSNCRPAFPCHNSVAALPQARADPCNIQSNTCSNKDNYRRLPRQEVKTACRGAAWRANLGLCMRYAYINPMKPSLKPAPTPALEEAINEWHESVNNGDLERAARAVGDPIVVLGPKGAGPITPAQFADWVERSGIKLTARSWHPISDHLMVVEEDASWPASKAPTRVATMFRVDAFGGKVTAALRLPDLKSALELAYICRELAATQ